MTRQEIFDKTIEHLISMHGPSINAESELCLYRGEGGARCAVGLWIPDQNYHPAIEGDLPNALMGYIPEELHPHMALLCELQSLVHDAPSSRDRVGLHFLWNKEGLQKNINHVAERNGLQTREI